jgi:hypothetical protein
MHEALPTATALLHDSPSADLPVLSFAVMSQSLLIPACQVLSSDLMR